MTADDNGNTYVCYTPRETSIWFGDTEKIGHRGQLSVRETTKLKSLICH